MCVFSALLCASLFSHPVCAHETTAYHRKAGTASTRMACWRMPALEALSYSRKACTTNTRMAQGSDNVMHSCVRHTAGLGHRLKCICNVLNMSISTEAIVHHLASPCFAIRAAVQNVKCMVRLLYCLQPLIMKAGMWACTAGLLISMHACRTQMSSTILMPWPLARW